MVGHNFLIEKEIAMRRKLVDQRYKLPYFVANPISRIGEPQANEDDVDTAAEIITNYLQTDHDGYVRPLHILVCGANPRAVKAVVERMTYWQDDSIYRADASCVDDDLGDVLQHNKIIVLDLMDNAFGCECPYMLGKRGVLIWMMSPGEEADKLEADYRIDVKDLSVGEKRQCLKVATGLPFFVIDQLLDSDKDVLACIKHFAGGSEPINGTNGAPTDLSERTLREVFFPPFKAGVDAGAFSLMTAHNELNGIPCHENEWLMQEVLRGEWGFRGFVVSDWMDIEHLHDLHGTAENLKEAFYQSIMAGIDMHMHGLYWNELVTELVREGRIPESRIDESVRRILTVKFRLGLFEKPYADESKSMHIRHSQAHRNTALEAARNGIVLLKNDGILPLKAKDLKRILVTGINADDQNILGDWSAPQHPENVVTILEGLRQIAPHVEFDFIDQGWDPCHMDKGQVEKAAQHARLADLNIVVAGEYMMRYRWTERTDGEDTDRSDIALVGLQEELLQKVAASGKPTVLILINGRPLGVEWADEHIPAIVEAWAPGMYGGQAIAEILFGQVNPSAKLAITIPRSVGQIQMIYNHKPSQYFHPYAAGEKSTPLYPFGHGLSYTTYEYSNLVLSSKEIDADETLHVSIDVTNIGEREGTEIVQLYIRDRFSSVTRPVKELKDFARVSLKPGESKTLTFEITPEKLAFYNRKMNRIVEPGEFIVMVGASSSDDKLIKENFYVK